MKAIAFSCDQCGACCRNLKSNEIYTSLDRGDGTCRFYSEINKSCSIYADRPIFCRVDESYKFFEKDMSIGTYIAINLQACKDLKNFSN